MQSVTIIMIDTPNNPAAGNQNQYITLVVKITVNGSFWIGQHR